MANKKSTKKRTLTNEIRRARNVARRSEIKTATKKVLTALANNDAAAAQEMLKEAVAQISRAQNKGVLKSNTASRRISRLTLRVAAAAQS
jgi:small subunit ribosomal protein S20